MKKNVKFLIIVLILLSFLLNWDEGLANSSIISVFIDNPDEGTIVGGIISNDTDWNLQGSPYIFSSDVQVDENITLTVDPGVQIIGDNYVLQIWGTLDVKGSNDSKVSFKDTRIGAGINGTATYLIDIKHATINGGGIYGLVRNRYGILNLTDSQIENTTTFINIDYPVSDCKIERNIFINSEGIRVGLDNEIQVVIRNNLFYEQTGGFAIENWATYGGKENMIVENNSFLSTNKIALYLREMSNPVGMTATHNFWNTTNDEVIDNMIFDRNDNLEISDYINPYPILNEPHPDTPELSISNYYLPIVIK